MIDDVDKKVIQLIQGDLPLDLRPFAVLAEKAGISEEEFVERVASLKERNHQEVRRHPEAPGGGLQVKCHGRLNRAGGTDRRGRKSHGKSESGNPLLPAENV